MRYDEGMLAHFRHRFRHLLQAELNLEDPAPLAELLVEQVKEAAVTYNLQPLCQPDPAPRGSGHRGLHRSGGRE